jgi:hypothetical protein
MAREVAGILSADIEREAFHLGITEVIAVDDRVARTITEYRGGRTSGPWADFHSLRSPSLTRH